MARHHTRVEHTGWIWFKDFIVFVYHYVLSYFKPNRVYKDETHDEYGRDLKPQSSNCEQTCTPVKNLVEQEAHVVSPTLQKASSSHEPIVTSPTPTKVIERYKPLVLPLFFHPLPTELINQLPHFDGENKGSSAEEHVQNLEDLLELYEIEEDDVCIRMFALSLQGNVKSWFKCLPVASIFSFHQFSQVFLDRWAVPVNIFLILEEYQNLRRQPTETVQEFLARFNKVYNAIPSDIKPPLGWALLHYPSSFDPEVEFHIRQKEPLSLEEMQDIAITVEYNIQCREERLRAARKD